MLDPDSATTPEMYAKVLAKYIKDPSTIRARTKDYWGCAPSLERCKKILEEANPVKRLPTELKFLKGKGWKCDHPRTEENIIVRESGNVVCRTCYRQMQAVAAREYRRRLQQAQTSGEAA